MSINSEGFEDRPVPVRPLDEEQARLLAILRAAGGDPVSFRDLRERGIDNPAVLCYELEIAGLPIRHVERAQPGGHSVPVGVQLQDPWLTAPEAPEPPRRSEVIAGWWEAGGERASNAARAGRATLASLASLASRQLGAGATQLRARKLPWLGHLRERPLPWRRGPRRWMLLGAPAVVVLALFAAALTGGGAARRHGASAQLSARVKPALLKGVYGTSAAPASLRHRASHLGARPDGTESSAASTNAARPTGSSEPGASAAARLQSDGHELLAEGRYAAATADLRAALSASEVSTAHCEAPSSEACLTYAYALYDLGRALQAEHDPSAAVPILNARMRIDNQRSTVLAALKTARDQLHETSHWTPPQHEHAAYPRRSKPHAHQPSPEHGTPEGRQQSNPSGAAPPANGANGEGEGPPRESGPGGAQAPSAGTPG